MSRKRRNTINIADSLELLRSGYGLNAVKFNFYQFRITQEESDDVYDWYHTTGSLVVNRKGYLKKIGVFLTPEEVAIIINKQINEKI